MSAFLNPIPYLYFHWLEIVDLKWPLVDCLRIMCVREFLIKVLVLRSSRKCALSISLSCCVLLYGSETISALLVSSINCQSVSFNFDRPIFCRQIKNCHQTLIIIIPGELHSKFCSWGVKMSASRLPWGENCVGSIYFLAGSSEYQSLLLLLIV